MIDDLLCGTITKMSEVVEKERYAQTLEAQSDLQSSFANYLAKAENSVDILQHAVNELGFAPTNTAVNLIKSSLLDFKNAIDNQTLKIDDIRSAKKKYDSYNAAVEKEWKVFHKVLTSATINTLGIISSISISPVEPCIQTLQNCNTWPTNVLAVSRFHASLNNAKKLISDVNLNPEVEDFLIKITNRKACYDDLNPTVVAWIKTQGLGSKIKLSF